MGVHNMQKTIKQPK